jgi:ABC-type nitrate/sulfonate/bicarbonate transport system substrate-binding protein
LPNPIDRRAFLRGAALLGGAVAFPSVLAACGNDDSKTATTPTTGGSKTPDYGKLSYQLSWIKNVEFAGEYIADTSGYYKDVGFTSVELLAGGPNVQQDAIVASGKALVGISAPDITSSAINQGAGIQVIGAQYQKNPFCVMSLASKPINTPQDMLGKKIGVQSVNEPVWNAFIETAGLDASKIDKVPVQFDPQPLVNGEVDGWFSFVTNEPNLLKVQGVDTVTFLLNDHGYTMCSEIMVVQTQSIKDDRDKLKALLVADIRGWRDQIKDPTISPKLVVENYGKDLGLTEAEQLLESKAENELIYTADAKANGLFTLTDELIADTIKTLGVAKIDMTAKKLFDMSLLKEVYEEHPELKAAIV